MSEPLERVRLRNPFHDPLVSELIEDPDLYRKMFSEKILVGETLAVYQPTNVVVLGPQGSGKSMILNLIRHSVFRTWFRKGRKPPAPLRDMEPFLGISINLVRANFHVFGRRSVASAMAPESPEKENLDATCAADFLNHYLFREFLMGLREVLSTESEAYREWLGLARLPSEGEVARTISSWPSWLGYYEGIGTLGKLLSRVDERLQIWRSFLNTNLDSIPEPVWSTKTTLGEPLHEMGNLLGSLTPRRRRLPVFVTVDQYEVLPELNIQYGSGLQRVVNTLIKARDPVVFYKVGARTYDWGRELRVWGAESRIELQRDYTVVNLGDVLVKKENDQNWLFPKFARDVAYKRIRASNYSIKKADIDAIFGEWDGEAESRLYFRRRSPKSVILKDVPQELQAPISSACGPKASPLELKLACAWVLQALGRGKTKTSVLKELPSTPWRRESWRKERIHVALLQVASAANQAKKYFGWRPLTYLCGYNVSSFLWIFSEIWDVAAKVGRHPLKDLPLDESIQTEAIMDASRKWRDRDRNEFGGGSHRYHVLQRLGPAIHRYLKEDLAISNPGHSGFSLREEELFRHPLGRVVQRFLEDAVSWGILEERPHTSKEGGGATRRKWYLHALLSPVFGIPFIRTKEPAYVNVQMVYEWIHGSERVRYPTRRRQKYLGPTLPFGPEE